MCSLSRHLGSGSVGSVWSKCILSTRQRPGPEPGSGPAAGSAPAASTSSQCWAAVRGKSCSSQSRCVEFRASELQPFKKSDLCVEDLVDVLGWMSGGHAASLRLLS